MWLDQPLVSKVFSIGIIPRRRAFTSRLQKTLRHEVWHHSCIHCLFSPSTILSLFAWESSITLPCPSNPDTRTAWKKWEQQLENTGGICNRTSNLLVPRRTGKEVSLVRSFVSLFACSPAQCIRSVCPHTVSEEQHTIIHCSCDYLMHIVIWNECAHRGVSPVFFHRMIW